MDAGRVDYGRVDYGPRSPRPAVQPLAGVGGDTPEAERRCLAVRTHVCVMEAMSPALSVGGVGVAGGSRAGGGHGTRGRGKGWIRRRRWRASQQPLSWSPVEAVTQSWQPFASPVNAVTDVFPGLRPPWRDGDGASLIGGTRRSAPSPREVHTSLVAGHIPVLCYRYRVTHASRLPDSVAQVNGTQRAGRGTEPMRHIRLLATFTAVVALAAAAVTPSFAGGRRTPRWRPRPWGARRPSV